MGAAGLGSMVGPLRDPAGGRATLALTISGATFRGVDLSRADLTEVEGRADFEQCSATNAHGDPSFLLRIVEDDPFAIVTDHDMCNPFFGL